MDFEQKAQLDLKDIELIRKGGAELERGISNLFKRYYQSFFQYYRRNGCDEACAEDMVQEVFVKVVRKIDTFRGDCPVGAWLWTVVRRIGYDRPGHNDRAVAVEGSVLEFLIGSLDETNDDEVINCVRSGFNQFSVENNERAQVLTLVSFNGWNIPDVAQFLERTPGATREYVSQCRKKLKPFIQHCLELLVVA